jgi:hypothetical protein
LARDVERLRDLDLGATFLDHRHRTATKLLLSGL